MGAYFPIGVLSGLTYGVFTLSILSMKGKNIWVRQQTGIWKGTIKVTCDQAIKIGHSMYAGYYKRSPLQILRTVLCIWYKLWENFSVFRGKILTKVNIIWGLIFKRGLIIQSLQYVFSALKVYSVGAPRKYEVLMVPLVHRNGPSISIRFTAWQNVEGESSIQFTYYCRSTNKCQ